MQSDLNRSILTTCKVARYFCCLYNLRGLHPPALEGLTMFQKAQRRAVKLKVALTGPSGSGKTYSALKLAKGFGGKVAVIDSENGSASLYADQFDFDTMSLRPPYTVDKYVDAILAAVKAGYKTVIVDSITHQWKGEGGILDRKEKLDARGGNSFANWAKMTPEQDRFMACILNSDIHLIATMRSKQEYILTENDKGKQQPKKVGMAPVQRDGAEYEFTTVFDIAMNHEAEASKDRTGLFADRIFKISEATGEEFLNWLNSAAPPSPPTPTAQNLPPEQGAATAAQRPHNYAPGAHNPPPVQQAAPPPIPTGGGPAGEFLIKHGTHTGKKIKDVPARDLLNYAEKVRQWSAANKKDPAQETAELVSQINAFFSWQPEAPEPGFDDAPLPAEDIPDPVFESNTSGDPSLDEEYARHMADPHS